MAVWGTCGAVDLPPPAPCECGSGPIDNRPQVANPMPLVFPTIGNAAEVCGADPRVCAGRLVPHLEQRGQRLAGCDRPTRASAAVQGDRPTIGAGALSGKTSGNGLPTSPTASIDGSTEFSARL